MKALKKVVFGFAAVLLVTLIILTAYRLISGKSLGLRSLVENSIAWATNPFKMAINGERIAQENKGDFTNIVFLHHSTGSNLISQGHLRRLLENEGFDFWDHGYNYQGLRGPEVGRLGYNYSVPNDNTDPDGLIEIFRQPELPVALNTFTALMQHEVIVYKSCFKPGNRIRSDEQLQQYKDWYVEMRAVMAERPDKVFVVMTIPPLNPAETNAAEAARARDFANWLMSEDFRAGQNNIYVFDFYTLLAENDPAAPDYNMLRAGYRDGDDSHPNEAANQAVAPLFAEFIKTNVEQYRAIASATVETTGQ